MAALVAASAAIEGTSQVSAVAAHQREATGGVAAGAQLQAVGLVTRAALAAVGGQAGLGAAPLLRHAASAALAGSASLQAFVLRTVEAQGSILGAAELVAIPTAMLGSAAYAAGAQVAATATRVQPARADAPSSGVLLLSAAPVVTQHAAVGVFQAWGRVRAEPSVNNQVFGFADPACTTELAATAVLYKLPVAAVVAAAGLAATATKAHPGRALPAANAALLVVEPVVVNVAMASIQAGCTLAATGSRVHLATATAPAGVALAAWCNQRHAAASGFAAGGALAALPTRTTSGGAAVAGSAAVAAVALRALLPSGLAPIGGGAEVDAAPALVSFGECLIDGGGAIAATADRVLLAAAQASGAADVTAQAAHRHDASANTVGAAELSASALRIVQPVAPLEAGAQLTGTPTRRTFAAAMTPIAAAGISVTDPTVRTSAWGYFEVAGQAQLICAAGVVLGGSAAVGGAASLAADTLFNAAARDPDSRTFHRPGYLAAFRRFQEPELRRAA